MVERQGVSVCVRDFEGFRVLVGFVLLFFLGVVVEAVAVLGFWTPNVLTRFIFVGLGHLSTL